MEQLSDLHSEHKELQYDHNNIKKELEGRLEECVGLDKEIQGLHQEKDRFQKHSDDTISSLKENLQTKNSEVSSIFFYIYMIYWVLIGVAISHCPIFCGAI